MARGSIDQDWAQTNLARVQAGHSTCLRLLNWKVAWSATAEGLKLECGGRVRRSKVFGTEFFLDAFRLLMEVMGRRGYLTRGSVEAVVEGMVEMLYPESF